MKSLIFIIYLFLITFLPNVFKNISFFSAKTNKIVGFYLAIISNSGNVAYGKANSLCAKVNEEHLNSQEVRNCLRRYKIWVWDGAKVYLDLGILSK